MIVLTVHLAYKVTSAAVVYPPTNADPEVVVDQPPKLYPVFANVPTVGSVTEVPAVV